MRKTARTLIPLALLLGAVLVVSACAGAHDEAASSVQPGFTGASEAGAKAAPPVSAEPTALPPDAQTEEASRPSLDGGSPAVDPLPGIQPRVIQNASLSVTVG